MTETLILRDASWRVVVAPTHGGSLQRCEFRGQTVLQPTQPLPGGTQAPQSHCYFPLIPFSNRIQKGEFAFGGQRIRLPANLVGADHPIHGHGWQSAWGVDSHSATACDLLYRHAASIHWPWSYEGTQTFRIEDDALRITLGIRNLGAGAMPCGLGFHPFFPARAQTRLQLHAQRVWNGSAAEFPREPIPVPRHLCFRHSALLSQRAGTDHCFDGWQRRAAVTSEGSESVLLVEGCANTSFLVLYVPRNADYFCIEPVTHAVNAMNLPDPAAAGLWTLAPGQYRAITMSIVLRA